MSTTEVGRLQAVGDGTADIGVEPRTAMQLEPPHGGVVETSMRPYRGSAGTQGPTVSEVRSRWPATDATTNSAKASSAICGNTRAKWNGPYAFNVACNSCRRCNACKVT